MRLSTQSSKVQREEDSTILYHFHLMQQNIFEMNVDLQRRERLAATDTVFRAGQSAVVATPTSENIEADELYDSNDDSDDDSDSCKDTDERKEEVS